MSQATWSVNGTLAKFSGNAQVVFDQHRPSLGLAGFESDTWPGCLVSLLAVEVPGRSAVDPPLDSFVRQNTIVSAYPPRESDLVRHQIRYAIAEHHGQTVFDLILSAQTSLLKSHPTITVRSQLRDVATFVFCGGELRELSESTQYVAGDPRPVFFLVRPRELADVSFVAIQQPGDFFTANVSVRPDDQGGQTELTYQVFPDSLEKGVIRRARFQHCHVPRDGDHQEAERLAAELANSAPVLNS